MKLNYLFLTAMVAAGAMVASAQDTNLSAPIAQPAATPATVAPAESAPAPEASPKPVRHKSKKAAAKKKNQEKKSQVMKYDPPVTGTAKDEVVNVRGQPNFVGEVVGHLKKGETVMVYETVTIAAREKDEPAKWDRIDLPTNRLVWVDAQFVDSASQTVKAKKLNVRGGPGENYSVVGRLEKGDSIAEVRKEKGWIGINPPTNAYAYVAAECLTLGPAVAPVAPPPAPAPVVVQTPVEAPAPTPAQPEPTAPAPTPASQTDQEIAALRKAMEPPAPTVAAAAPATPPTILPGEVPPRIVTREGFVHRAYNIQAPADYELHDIKTGDVIDFLQPQSGQNFKMYIGTRITVTGAEVMDTRWPRTPILQVQSVDLMP
jgi:uncharacterized protein YgiM (DUF1202 family)